MNKALEVLARTSTLVQRLPILVTRRCPKSCFPTARGVRSSAVSDIHGDRQASCYDLDDEAKVVEDVPAQRS
jgi:hypothetical protein